MPPINPLLVKSGLQALNRIGQQAGKLATAAPGLAEKATGAARLAAKQMSGLSGLAERLPSASTLQSGIAGLRPRLQNASLLGKMGRPGQAGPMGPMGSMGPTGPLAHSIPLGQFNQIRQSAQSALHKPMAAALQGSERASRAASAFLQALHDIESSALYQNFSTPLVAQMLGEARTGLQAIHDMIQRFQSGLGKLSGEPKPSLPGAMPRPPLAQPHPSPLPSSSRPTAQAGPSAQKPTPQQPAAPLGIGAKPLPVSLMNTTPAEGVKGLRDHGVDLKALQQDMRNFKLHAQPSHDELLDKYKDSADLSIVDDGPKLAKFMLALNGAVRADAAA